MEITTIADRKAHPWLFFEGTEKRIEIDFHLGRTQRGLRSLSADELDDITAAAECLIVSRQTSGAFDAYVLSESSLFVHATKFILKTCGTTKLLNAIPPLIDAASKIGMKARCVKYSRSTFMWPEKQPLGGNFDKEVEILDGHFRALSPDGGDSFVLGSKLRGAQWHVYISGDGSPSGASKPTISFEVCMTRLDALHSAHFFRGAAFESAAKTTEECGVRDLFPEFEIDPYVFDPCGYSMNALSGSEYATVHITPEHEASHASVEYSEVCASTADPSQFINRVAAVFKPGELTCAISTVATTLRDDIIKIEVPAPPGYRRVQTSYQELGSSGQVVEFYSYSRHPPNLPDDVDKPRTPVADQWKELSIDSKQPKPLVIVPANTIPTDSVETPPIAEVPRSSSVSNFEGWNITDSQSTIASSQLAAIDGLRSKSPPTLSIAGLFAATYDSEVIRALEDARCFSMVGSGDIAIDDFCLDVIASNLARTAADSLARFCVVDLGVVMRRWRYWYTTMPRVTPHYAVKCNSDRRILSTLAALGACFDCASPSEIDAVFATGVAPDRIIYGNPCKMPAHLARVRSMGVDLTTFDSIAELVKLRELAPDMRVLLRLRADDPDARCILGNKYGAEPSEIEGLLTAAKHFGVHVAGVAFHVGSGAANPLAFREALELSKYAFDTAEKVGLPRLQILDIGGGFSGSVGQTKGTNLHDVCLGVVANEINATLDRLFPASSGVRIIAEPGRYFAEATTTLATMVFSTRVRGVEDGQIVAKDGDTHQYFISDGLYGMMNCILYDHASVVSRALPVATNAAALSRGDTDAILPRGIYSKVIEHNPSSSDNLCKHPSTVFGPTCDGLDKVHDRVMMPELNVGDWLLFPNMGAYTASAGSNFNGFDCACIDTFYIASVADG